MSKKEALKVALDSLSYAVDYHEWCDGGERARCASCHHLGYSCQDQGHCDGCRARESAIQALAVIEGRA